MASNSIEFVRYVKDHAGITQAALAEQFQLSTRTVRARVQRANNEMKGFGTIVSARGGYSVAITDEDAYARWLDQHLDFIDGAIPSNQDERVDYLLHDLLERTDWITLEDLSRILYISRSRLSRCIGRVEETLARFDLTLEKRPHYGMRVRGTELNRRMCLASLTIEAINRSGGALESLAGGTGRHQTDRELLRAIVSCVNESAKAADFHINSAAYQNLIVHITIALMRIQEHCYMPMGDEYLAQIKGTHEFSVAQDVARRIKDALGVALPEEEVAYIAIHLAGKQALPPASPSEEADGLVISDEVWDVVSEILEAVWNAFRFDFRDDLELRMNLARHIVPLAVRLRFNMPLKNPMLADVRTRYPLAFSMAVESASVLARHYDSTLSDDEIGYIAFAFALALERMKSGRPKKNILVVCASGAGSARLLEYRCRQEFGEYVDKIKTCDVMGLDSADLSDIDYVFTTVPVNRSLPVPVLEIEYFLDLGKVEEARDLLRADGSEAAGDAAVIEDALFFPHLAHASKEEVLDFLLDRMCDAYALPSEFRELVWKREAMMATALGNLVAMPHPAAPVCDETHVCIGVLDHPVMWDNRGHEAQVICLMAVSRGAADMHRDLLSALASLFYSKEAIENLIERPTKENLCALIERGLQEGSAS